MTDLQLALAHGESFVARSCRLDSVQQCQNAGQRQAVEELHAGCSAGAKQGQTILRMHETRR